MKKIIIFAACLLSMASCKKFLDVNKNPNSPTDAPAKVLLPTTTIGLGWANGNELGRAAAIFVQYNAGIANNALLYENYNLDGAFGNQWDYEVYNGAINNLRLIISKTEDSSPAYSGIAKLQLAYMFSVATDLWGDVPYSQAGFGLQFKNPRYDSQQDIYQGNSSLGITSLFDLVKSGLDDLSKTSATKPTTDDLVYGGVLDSWKKVGNTLLLKFANQISVVNPTMAKSVISDVIAGNNFITDNSQDFAIPFSTAAGNQNPLYQQDFASFKDNQMLSSRFLARVKTLNDTVRLSKFYTKPLTTRFVGYENGAVVAAPTVASRSIYNTYVVGKGDAPVRLLTNFQVKFILAESALKLGTPGNANQLFQDGIKASMAKVGMTTAEVSQYFTDNANVVTLSGTDEQKLEQIITQKYIAWVGNGIESYNDFRRTGYPQLLVSTNAKGDDPTTIPKRLPYTLNEGNSNPNQPKPRPKTNVKVWWGK